MSSRWVLVASTTVAGAVLALSSVGVTFASLVDNADTHASASAATWGLDVPPECTGMRFDHIAVMPAGQRSYIGTNKNDLIFANDLGDTIHGGNGDDCIVGGSGDDVLHGDNGRDVLIGGPGNDVINGDNAPDVGLYGGPGNDVINGDNGPDHVDGGSGTDICNGGAAPDRLVSCETVS